MLFSIRTDLSYEAAEPCDLLLQIEAASDISQHCEDARLSLPAGVMIRQISGEESIGARRWIRAENLFECTYEARVDVIRAQPLLGALAAGPVSETPSDVTKFLMGSRYCHPEAFFDFVPTQFARLNGGALIAALRDWIESNFTYDNGASDAATTAADSFNRRAGVCRDYAHVLIAMARAAGIPARFASVYAPDVMPQDFHAVAEVYLEGAWRLVDATGMAQPNDMVRIGVGRDAADVSFMTSYGWMELKKQSVTVTRVN